MAGSTGDSHPRVFPPSTGPGTPCIGGGWHRKGPHRPWTGEAAGTAELCPCPWAAVASRPGLLTAVNYQQSRKAPLPPTPTPGQLPASGSNARTPAGTRLLPGSPEPSRVSMEAARGDLVVPLGQGSVSSPGLGVTDGKDVALVALPVALRPRGLGRRAGGPPASAPQEGIRVFVPGAELGERWALVVRGK